MQSLDTLLHEAEIAHGHLCAGQVLGVRMAMLGCRLLGIDEPRSGADRKRLVTFVEIDRCATDAIAVVTGCRLGKRALKFRDWGKMAASFLDLQCPIEPAGEIPAYKAVRIAALESSKDRARELHPDMPDKNAQQMLAYRELPDQDLFSTQWVAIPLHPRERPGYKSARIACGRCGEGINYDRQAEVRALDQDRSDRRGGAHAQTEDGAVLCQSCADPRLRYFQAL